MAKNKKRMRRGQMIAIAALMTSAVAPYAVSADTTGSATTTDGTSTLDVTSSEAVSTATVAGSNVITNVDYVLSTGASIDEVDANAAYYKSMHLGNVDLEITADGKKYALITLQGHTYAYDTITNADDSPAEITSESGSASGKDWVRNIRVELNDKYQATFKAIGTSHGNTTFHVDLAQEKFDVAIEAGDDTLDNYVKSWVNSADTVSLKDGSKVALISFSGTSYAVETIYEGKDTTTPATVVASQGTPNTKDYVRTVRVALGKDNKVVLNMPNSRLAVTAEFDFSEKDAVADFATIGEVASAKALEVEFTSTNSAQFWLGSIVKTALSNPTAKAVNGKFEVSFDSANIKSLTVTQNGTEVPVKIANGKATLTVDSLEGLTFDGVFFVTKPTTGEVSESAASATLTKAQAGEAIVEETPTPTIPSTTDVVSKKAKVSFKASSESLNSYFQHGFFDDVSIVEIDGQTYADLGIVYKSIGLEYNYIMENGTVAKALEVTSNRSQFKQNEKGEYIDYDTFAGTVRIPVTVDKNGAFTFTLDTYGGQPGSDSQSNYQFTFTGKIQNDVAIKYSDVKAGTDTAKYVQQLANWGALNLNLAKFNPGGEITRGQFALMIARTLEVKPAKANQFKDVKDTEMQAAVQALFEAGIIKGYDNNTKFKPNQKITRTQAAIMINRLLTEKLGYTSTAKPSDLSFNDADDVKSAEAKQAFATLQAAKIMTGDAKGFLNPSSKLKRSQMAKILVEALNVAGFDK
jgi:hypothetical protein